MRAWLLVLLAYLGVMLLPFLLLALAIVVDHWRINRQASYFRREIEVLDLTRKGR